MKRLNFGWPLVLTAALVGAMTLTAKSQEANSTPATPSLSLDALVTEALERNPELKFYEAELAAARAGRKTAGLLANPEVNGSIGEKTVRGGGVSAEGVAWSVSVVQPFEWPGRIGLRKAVANRDVELAELGFARFKLALAGRMLELGYGLFAAQEKAAAAGEVADRFQALREAAKARQTQAQVSLAVAQREVERKVLEAALTYETKLREMTKWRPDSVQHFKEAAELADRHYRLGAVPISTCVELQKQYLEAVESLLETKQAALEAVAQLELLTGWTPKP